MQICDEEVFFNYFLTIKRPFCYANVCTELKKNAMIFTVNLFIIKDFNDNFKIKNVISSYFAFLIMQSSRRECVNYSGSGFAINVNQIEGLINRDQSIYIRSLMIASEIKIPSRLNLQLLLFFTTLPDTMCFSMFFRKY